MQHCFSPGTNLTGKHVLMMTPERCIELFVETDKENHCHGSFFLSNRLLKSFKSLYLERDHWPETLDTTPENNKASARNGTQYPPPP